MRRDGAAGSAVPFLSLSPRLLMLFLPVRAMPSNCHVLACSGVRRKRLQQARSWSYSSATAPCVFGANRGRMAATGEGEWMLGHTRLGSPPSPRRDSSTFHWRWRRRAMMWAGRRAKASGKETLRLLSASIAFLSSYPLPHTVAFPSAAHSSLPQRLSPTRGRGRLPSGLKTPSCNTRWKRRTHSWRGKVARRSTSAAASVVQQQPPL